MTASELYDLAKGFKPNDIVFAKSLKRNPHTKIFETVEYSFRITNVVVDGDTVGISYTQSKRDDTVQCLHGYLPIKNIDCHVHKSGCWGVQSLEVVGSQAPKPYSGHGWMVRNPGYDSLY